MNAKSASYLIVGNGRLARHLQHYFTLLNIPFSSWSRSTNTEPELHSLLLSRPTVLLAISDSAILEFYNNHLKNNELRVVHFSGALYFREITGAHPLMTFSKEFYSQKVYESIVFVCDTNINLFRECFSKLSNECFEIRPEDKARYHALCVMSGNFTTLLWQKAFRDFETKLGLPAKILYPYLTQIAQNLIEDSHAALTGPLARKDINTIKKHLDVLNEDDFAPVYRSFVEAVTPDLAKEVL